MESILFGAVMLAIGWLVFWVGTDHSKPSNIWWPFDYRTKDPVESAGDEPERRAGLQRTHRQTGRPWKRSGF